MEHSSQTSVPMPPVIAQESRRRLGLKAVVVAALTVLLMVPLALVNGTIGERANYRQQAVAAVAASYAGPQVVAGPVLVVPYSETVQVMETDAYGKPVARQQRSQRQWLFFPRTLSLEGKLKPSIRKRGLHEVRVYEMQSDLNAHFDLVLAQTPAGSDRQIGQPFLSFAISDVRGLLGTPKLTRDAKAVALQQGPGERREGGGLHAVLQQVLPGEHLRFDARFQSTLAGTESMAVAPVADSNHVRLSSTWPHPQFAGRFLPRGRDISDAGFDARWDISALAAGTQAQLLEGRAAGELDALQVGLVEPVNIYSQADRASKYGVLFIGLTFVAFFLFELLKRLPIHPIQYAFVGLSLAIFFLLLISLSEHVAFWIAYLAASGACIGLLTVYLSAVLRSRMRGIGFATGLALLYAALYGLLVSEDNALVLGSLMLFAILAVLMILTRRIDWYAPSSGVPA